MKVVYLTLEAPREGQASYVHVHEIIAGLQRQNVDVILYQPFYTNKKKSPHLLLRVFYALLLQLRLWLNWPRGAVIYVRAHYLAYPTALIAKIFNITIIHEVNGTYGDVFVSHPSLRPFEKLLVPMQRWQYKMGVGVVAVTTQLQNWVNDEGGRTDCAFISNGANIDVFKPNLPKPLDAPDQYVVFFGGLARWHGVHVMLRAVKREDWPNSVKMVIIGEGQKTKHVEQAAAKNKNIIYLGKKPYKEVASYVSNALAGVVMINNPKNRSSKGVFPLKLFETLACGIPAIVSDLAGQADLIRDHKCGIVVPCNDDAKLSDAVNFLISYPEEKNVMGDVARQITVDSHSWFARSQETLSFIQSFILKS